MPLASWVNGIWGTAKVITLTQYTMIMKASILNLFRVGTLLIYITLLNTSVHATIYSALLSDSAISDSANWSADGTNPASTNPTLDVNNEHTWKTGDRTLTFADSKSYGGTFTLRKEDLLKRLQTLILL